jgi:glutathione S-transferase
MPELQIIGAPQSNYVCTTRITCLEKGVPYTLVTAAPHTPEADAIHPFGKIPVMRHGDVTLSEFFYMNRMPESGAMLRRATRLDAYDQRHMAGPSASEAAPRPFPRRQG